MKNSKQSIQGVKYVIGVDPSGNFTEGKGTTGIAVYDIENDKIDFITDVFAGDFNSREEYFAENWKTLYELFGEYTYLGKTVISIEDYVLYAGDRQRAQTNSHMETPMLLGYLLQMFWNKGITYTIRTASQAKPRWTEDVLVAKGYIYQKGNKYTHPKWVGGLKTHHRDAMKHALQCGKFEVNK